MTLYRGRTAAELAAMKPGPMLGEIAKRRGSPLRKLERRHLELLRIAYPKGGWVEYLPAGAKKSRALRLPEYLREIGYPLRQGGQG